MYKRRVRRSSERLRSRERMTTSTSGTLWVRDGEAKLNRVLIYNPYRVGILRKLDNEYYLERAQDVFVVSGWM